MAGLAYSDLLGPGFGSNLADRSLKHIYFSAMLGAATWGAELANGEGRGRICIVEPTGALEDDPDLTDEKFLGIVAASSYNSVAPLRLACEVEDWIGHPPVQLQAMRDGLAQVEAEGAGQIFAWGTASRQAGRCAASLRLGSLTACKLAAGIMLPGRAVTF
jgi:rifampin ADP-ribosylating transferase